MNSRETTILIKKHTKNDYETRFLLQSKNHSPNANRSPNDKKSSKRMKSQALHLLGGIKVLDFLSILLAERIADDHVLSEIYCELNTKTLAQIQKELLLLALDDDMCKLSESDMKKVSKKERILKYHVLRGLMDRADNFVRLAKHLTDALIACQINEKAILETQLRFELIQTQLRFELIRNLLQTTHEEHLQSGHNAVENLIRLPDLKKTGKKKKKKKEGNTSTKSSWWQLE